MEAAIHALEAFASSAWFLTPLLALAAGVLALAPLGSQVLRRGVVFIDLAVAQSAAAAALAATALQDHAPWLVVQLAGVGGALLAAALVAVLARTWAQHREALIGLIYVVCACTALLLARLDVHGPEHLHALLAADLLWSNWTQVTVLVGCAALVLFARQRLSHDAWFFIVFAIVAALAVQVLGLFIVFAALIAPGLWHQAGLRLPTATALALAAASAGLALSWFWDAPSGPLVAFALALCGACSALKASRQKASASQA